MAAGTSTYPTVLDNYSEVNSNDVIRSVDINDLQAAIEAVETYVGISGASFPTGITFQPSSAVTSVTIDQNYNAASLAIDSEATSVTSILGTFANTSGNIIKFTFEGQHTDGSGLFFIISDNANSTSPIIAVRSDGAGTCYHVNQDGNGAALIIDSEATSATSISGTYAATSGNIIKHLFEGAHTDGSAMFFIHADHANTTSPVLFIRNDGTGNTFHINMDNSGTCINLDQDANDANACYGAIFDIVNAGAGLEYAMRFNGSEIVGAAVGGAQDKKVRCSVAGVDYFIPLHTA